MPPGRVAADRVWALAAGPHQRDERCGAEPEVRKAHAHPGDEENLITGAQAYLAQRLGVRTHQQGVPYLRDRNGGMPLATAVYMRLREDPPDRSPGRGFGPWAADALGSGRIRPEQPSGFISD